LKDLNNQLKNKSIIKKVMEIALQDLPDQIRELEGACKEKHPEKVNSAAHKIKGSSSYMRFSLITKIADQIERESTDAWNDELELHLSELKAEWEIVQKIVESKLAQLSTTI
jgi:HPt (histidine-containing phosphotransfer) domain-containing protein